jgi:predicted AlkP superfamily pyrophosphatase or phosphodiesterase
VPTLKNFVHMKNTARAFWLLLLAALLPTVARAASLPPRPRLILFIAIDQFRADYLLRFERRFLQPFGGKNADVGGFRFLMADGAYYPYGEYGILQSMTGPGHATMLTGAYPYQHGIPINYWYDETTHRTVSCVEDISAPLIGLEPNAVKPSMGASPRNLLASTVGDELKNAGYGSRVISISIKDRAAILMGGHRADLALWFEPTHSRWISSRYYLPSGELPPWVVELNSAVATSAEKRMAEFPVWRPEGKGSGFSVETNPPFAHPIVIGKEEALRSPYGGELIEQAAEYAFDKLGLGRGTAPTDLLAVSFSSHDIVGHEFGPNSREMEEMTVSEDHQISQLLNHIRTTLPNGLDDVAIVLTGDHGIPELPEYAAAGNLPSGRLNDADLAQLIEEKLTARYGKPSSGKKWVDFVADLNFYLNHDALEAKKIPLAQAAALAKSVLEARAGVFHVASAPETSSDSRMLPGLFGKQYEHTYFPGRTGDLLVIPKPGFMSGSGGANHHTGYAYDRTVPIILSGSRFFRPGVYAQEGRVIDIAPTLSFISGTIPPNMSEGRVLFEALKSQPGSP